MSQASKSARSTARGSSVGSKSARSTARSNVSFAESEMESVHTDYDAEYRVGPERCVFVIKPDALEQFENDIKEELETVVEACEATIQRYVKIQISRPNADRFAFLFQESLEREAARLIEEARLAEELAEAERLAAEAENMDTARSGSASNVSGSPRSARSSKKSTARSSKGSARSGSQKSSRKSTSRTARSARAKEEAERLAAIEAEKQEKRDQIASFLCSGQIGLALIEGEGCVEALRNLVGPIEKDLWEEAVDTLRGKYGEDELRNVCDTSISDIAGRKEAEFVDELFEELDRMDALMRGGKKPPAKKSEWVSLDGILNFCFPPGEWHPASTGRLAVFGNYGPLADDGNLRCGIRGDHIVSDVELKAMIEEMQREDILNVYIGNQRLQREEQEEILIQADEELHKVPQKSPEEIRKMFRHLKTNKKGQYSFHDLQRVILNERVKRVKKLMTMPCDRKNLLLVKLLRKALKAEREGKAKSRKKKWKAKKPVPIEKVADQDAYRINAMMLNRNTYRITEVNRGNIAGLTTNVKLLLPTRSNPFTSNKKGGPNWNTTACLTKTNKAHYVNKYSKVIENDKYK